MPDDEKITEQETSPPDTEYDEESAFSDDSDNDEIMERPVHEVKEEGADQAGEGDKGEEGDEGKPEGEAKEGETGEEGEDDEDIRRGRELLGEDSKKEGEEGEEGKGDKETQEGAQEPAADLTVEQFRESIFHAKHTPDSIKEMVSYIPENLLPDEVTLEDGTVCDFVELREENPGLIPAITAVAHNIVMQMVANNYLQTTEGMMAMLNERDLTHPQYGVPKAREIERSNEFKAWLDKQPKEIQALHKSDDTFDRLRVFRRFVNKEVLGEAKERADQHDERARDSKGRFVAVHKSTVKSAPKKPTGPTSEGGPDAERDAFYSDDDDDDFI